jgi:hypothetical protein
MSRLLEPLSDDQQELVDLLADAFNNEDEWPVFDYLEGHFDKKGIDASGILRSFPRAGRWGYGALYWVGQDQAPKPSLSQVIKLTVVGLHHSRVLNGLVDAVFDVINLMVVRRKTAPLSTRAPRDLNITDQEVLDLLRTRRRLGAERWSKLLLRMMDREPIIGWLQRTDEHLRAALDAYDAAAAS